MFRQKTYKIDEEDVERAIEDLRKGSAEAFHLLYKKYSAKIYRFCLKMLSNKELAEDAFQETFIKVYENRLNFRTKNFGAWIYKIARNTCINLLRTRRNYEDIEQSVKCYYIDNSDIEMLDFIRKSVEKLPPKLKEAFILREYEEFSYQEIADILSIDLSLAKVRVHRARLLLRKMLEPIVKDKNEDKY